MLATPTKAMIYVVDDDLDVLGSLQFLLETDGFDVRTFKSGAALLNDGASDDADCFVIDYKMPNINGLDLVIRLRRQDIDAPIILITGHPDETISDRAASAEALFQEKERAEITLDSIGDAVICTDIWGRVTYMNSVAENMTGWSRQDAAGHPLEDVLRIIDATTRQPVESPMTLAIRLNTTASLKPNCVLIRSDGAECAIEDSAAPIHDRRGRVTGAVIVFHDVSAARAQSLKWLISPNTTASPAYPIECC
jgi:PAS domain S-box-containing protein